MNDSLLMVLVFFEDVLRNCCCLCGEMVTEGLGHLERFKSIEAFDVVKAGEAFRVLMI